MAPLIEHIRLTNRLPLKVHLYLVLFSSYLTLNNIVTLKSGLSHSRSLKMVPFDSLGHISCSHSIVTTGLCCIISEINIDFFQTLLIQRPVRGVPVGICHNVWCGKTRMVCLPDGKKIFTIRLAVSTEHRRVTDRQTDILP